MKLFGKLQLLVVSLMIIACQKVIDLPLNDADVEYVVEVTAKNYVGANFAKLSLSGKVTNDGNYDLLSGGTIQVTDESGNVYDFLETEPGLYHADGFQVLPSTKYFLDVKIADKHITSETQTFKKPKIDSLSYQMLVGGIGGISKDTSYLIAFHSVDAADEKNYYWVKIYRNGEENEGFYLGNDDFINGQYYFAYFFGSEAKRNDTVLVELIGVDAANYDYLLGVSNIINDSGLGVAPANPPSNLTGTGFGYFGLYMVDTMSIIIP